VAQDTSQIREAIEEDRQALGETVQALVAKADVKARLKETVASGTEQIRSKAQQTAEKAQQAAGEVGKRVQELSPEQAKAEAAATADRVATTVKKRPVPFAVAALVAFAWMVARLRKTMRKR
jgi:methyl-accepting chemotaxis protein